MYIYQNPSYIKKVINEVRNEKISEIDIKND